MALTKTERNLLTHPPKPETWVCRAQAPLGEKGVKCGLVNAGGNTRCFGCRAARPAKPTLLWPLYERACKKARIEPGDKWPTPIPTPTTTAAKKPRARKRAS